MTKGKLWLGDNKEAHRWLLLLKVTTDCEHHLIWAGSSNFFPRTKAFNRFFNIIYIWLEGNKLPAATSYALIAKYDMVVTFLFSQR